MDKRELSEEQIGIPVQTAKDAEDIFIPPESCHKLKMQYVALDTSELSEEQIGVPVQTAPDAELAPHVIGPAYNSSDNKTIEEIAKKTNEQIRTILHFRFPFTHFLSPDKEKRKPKSKSKKKE